MSAAVSRATPVRAAVDVPGGLLLHPVVLAAIALFIVNDHVLKPAAHHSFVTGKLSDVAGLIFFPVLVAAIIEFAAPGARRRIAPLLLVATGLTGLTFIAMLTLPAAADGYRWFFGLAQWPFRVATALLSGAPFPVVVPVTFAADPTDLITLPGLIVPLGLAIRERRSRNRA